jgi:hypothetical protein
MFMRIGLRFCLTLSCFSTPQPIPGRGFHPTRSSLGGICPSNPLSRLIEPLLPAVDPKPLEQIREEVRAHLRRAAEQRRNSRRSGNNAFKVGDLVLLRENPVSDAAGRVFAKFCLFYSEPYLIFERPYPNV